MITVPTLGFTLPYFPSQMISPRVSPLLAELIKTQLYRTIFFDEDTNDILDQQQFIVSKSEKEEIEDNKKKKKKMIR